MAEKPDKNEPHDDEPRRKSDFVKTYVWGMALIALVLAGAWYKVSSDRDAYRKANAQAPAVFGGARPEGGTISEQRPTTISALAVGVLKFLQTYKDAKVKPEDNLGKGIPMKLITDRAANLLTLKNSPQEQTNKVQSKGYEEIYATFEFDPSDLDRLATFLYNFEIATTKFRVIDLRWTLRPDKENPLVAGVSFGNLILGPSVKIGYRRAVARS